MAKSKKSSRKPAVEVRDLRAKKDPKGGGTKKTATKDQQEFLVVKMTDVIITS